MEIIAASLYLSFWLFFVLREPAKAEKKPEQELGEAITKYLAKTKGNGSES